MKAALYAVKKGRSFVKDGGDGGKCASIGGYAVSGKCASIGGWTWFVSLDLKVDRAFWTQEAKDHTLLLLHPLLSLGQAVDWRDILNESGMNFTPDMPSGQLRLLILQGLGRAGVALSMNDPLMGTLECSLYLYSRPDEDQGCTLAGESLIRRRMGGKGFREVVCKEFGTGWSGYEDFCRSLLGRSLLPDEVVSLLEHLGEPDAKEKWRGYAQLAYLQGRVELLNGLAVTRKRGFPYVRRKVAYACRRCGSGGEDLHWTPCAACGEVCVYCEACLTMGRMRYCSLLVNGLTVNGSADKLGPYDANETAPLKKIMRQGMNDTSKWELSPSQREAAEAGVAFVLEEAVKAGSGSAFAGVFARARPKVDPSSFLIWAVTGAGKTEMIFPLIEAELARQGTVLIATPRKDVVLELEPRLKRAFPDNTLVTLYGGSVERWEAGEIMLATTHQLLRFWQKFDLVIIDEIDAFPFHNSPMLEFAARKVGKPSGKYIWLSATPPAAVQKAAQQKKLRYVRVPVRFHRRPLPVPQLMKVQPLHKLMEGSLPKSFLRALAFSLGRGAQVFIFVPKIRYIDVLIGRLRMAEAMDLVKEEAGVRKEVKGVGEVRKVKETGGNPSGTTLGEFCRIEGTSSKDPGRREKVVDFRQGVIRILVTTTILERGVTVPKTDVFVMDADSPMFDEAALVQMAGRAGRSSEDPVGWVYYAAFERTKSQTRAVRQITQMNRLARRKGYLLP
ncbi:MAG TPA: helicase-related protein [Bacilli bacterium]